MERFFEYLKTTVMTYRLESCCCVAPLRIGTLLIGYFNIAAALVLMVGVASSSFLTLAARVQEHIAEASSPLCVLGPAADLAFNTLLLCAVHRNDLVLLRVYMWYGVATIAASLLVYSLVVALLDVLYLIVIAISTLYQGYVIFLVRSVIVEIKLKRSSDKFIYSKQRETVHVEDTQSPSELAQTHSDIENVTLEIVNEDKLETDDVKRNIICSAKEEQTVDVKETLKEKAYVKKPDDVKVTLKKDISSCSTEAGPTEDVKDSVIKDDSYIKPPISETAQKPSEVRKEIYMKGSATSKDVKNKINTIATIETQYTIKNEDMIETDTKNKDGPVGGDVKDHIEELKPEVPQKKKRGIFRRAPKETNKQKDIKP